MGPWLSLSWIQYLKVVPLVVVFLLLLRGPGGSIQFIYSFQNQLIIIVVEPPINMPNLLSAITSKVDREKVKPEEFSSDIKMLKKDIRTLIKGVSKIDIMMFDEMIGNGDLKDQLIDNLTDLLCQVDSYSQEIQPVIEQIQQLTKAAKTLQPALTFLKSDIVKAIQITLATLIAAFVVAFKVFSLFFPMIMSVGGVICLTTASVTLGLSLAINFGLSIIDSFSKKEKLEKAVQLIDELAQTLPK